MVRKKIEFTMIKDKSRLRSTRNKRLVGLLKKEMKLNRLTAMPFASFYFVDDQLVRIASEDPELMIQRVLEHIRSGKSVQTLTPDDLEKLTNNELKIGVRRGNRGPYFSDECKTSQAHLSHEEQMIAMQTANNLRHAAGASMHGMSTAMTVGTSMTAGTHASGRQRRLSEVSSSQSQSSNRDDDAPDDMSENDDADSHDRNIKQDPNLSSVLNSSGMSGALTSSNSVPLALAASNLLSGLPMTAGGGRPMSEEDRKNAALTRHLMAHAGNPAGPPPSSSSGNHHGIQLPINYHLHQHLMLNSPGGSGSSTTVGRKRPRDGSDDYNVAMSQIEDCMSKEGMMIKEDPNAAQQAHQQIAGVPSLPPTLDIASLMQTLNNGGGLPTLDLSSTSSALGHLLASAGGPSCGGDLNDKFSALASILNNPGAHGVAPPRGTGPLPPPPGGPGSVRSTAELFSTNFSQPQMPPNASSSIQPPSSSSLGAPHPPRGSADLNFAASFFANDAIAPPSGPPPSGGPLHRSQGTSGGGAARRPNLDMMSVLK